MKFLVLIKQVPDVTEIRFDRDRKTLIRENVKNVINPYDRRAISEAIRHRNERGGEVVVVTMGPPQARDALREALLMGADSAIHVEDPALAGSDTLITARVLAALARRAKFDLILCGQHSTDSETGQVPPQLAELLQIAFAPAVNKIEYGEEKIQVRCETDEGTELRELSLPAVLSAAERLVKPIKVKEQSAIEREEDRIDSWTLRDLEMRPFEVGLLGSPTWVDDIKEQGVERRPEIWQGTNEREVAKKIVELLKQPNVAAPSSEKVPEPSPDPANSIWCWIENHQGRIRQVSLEILGTACRMAASVPATVVAVVVGPPPNKKELDVLSSYGADKTYYATSTAPHPDEVVALLADRITALKPYAFLFPASYEGKDIAARVAARLGIGLTGDCVGLAWGMQNRMLQWKPAFGGNIIASIYSRSLPQLATVRPGALPLPRPRASRKIPSVAWAIPYNAPRRFQIISRDADSGAQAVQLESAPIVVCIGMGLGRENIPSALRLSELLNAAVGATRRVVDNGWLPRQHQIGLTGKFITPQVYLGLGVSGRYNHTIGIQKAGKLVAINNDPQSEILKVVDVGIVGDCKPILAQMIDLLESKKS